MKNNFIEYEKLSKAYNQMIRDFAEDTKKSDEKKWEEMTGSPFSKRLSSIKAV